MAFTLTTFQYGRGVTTCATNGGGISTVMHGYKSADSYTVISTPGYFPANIDGATDKIFIGDVLLIVSASTVTMNLITSLDPFLIGSDLLGGAGSPITMNVPLAATDANAIQISGTTVQMEIADATHPGIVTQLDQVFAGIKTMMSGVKFMTFGGTPTTLNYYEEFTHSTTFTNGADTTGAQNIKLIRIGSLVNLILPDNVSTPGQGAPGVSFDSNTVVPARFRPATDITTISIVSNGGIFSSGIARIRPTGLVQVFNNANFTTAFTAAQINAFYASPITYSVL